MEQSSRRSLAWPNQFAQSRLVPTVAKIAAGGGDGDQYDTRLKPVRIWNVDSGEELIALKGHRQMISSLMFSPDGEQITSSDSISTKTWDVSTGEELKSTHEYKGRLSFSADRSRIAYRRGDTVELWDTATGDRLQSLQTGFVSCTSFGTAAGLLASGSADTSIKLWDTASGEAIRTLKGHESPVTDVCISSDGSRLASASVDGVVKVWNISKNDAVPAPNQRPAGYRSFSFSPDAEKVLSASGNTIQVWDSGTGIILRTLDGHAADINCACFSPDGGFIASASDDRSIRLWDGGSGEEIRTLRDTTRSFTT